MKKIVITGANGQLGFELRRALAPLGQVVALDRSACDLGDPNAVRATIRDSCPDIIVNAGAYTAVDKAETQRKQAWEINAQAPGILGEEAIALNALVVHFSTDYVFDGLKDGAYNEEDRVAPQSVYGETKLEGERALAATGARHLIFRTSWVAGVHGGNFAKTMLRLASERKSLSVVADQHGAPTAAALLADVTAQVLGRMRSHMDLNDASGTYHVAASGHTTWYDYARHVITTTLGRGMQLQLSPEDIRPVSTLEYPTAAKRPANSQLDTSKLRETFGLTLPHWRDGIDHILHQIIQKQ